MIDVKLDFDKSQIDRWIKALKGNIDEKTEQLVDDTAKEIYDKMVDKIPVDTGHLKSTAFNRQNGNVRQVGTDADYSKFVVAQPQSMRLNGRSEYLKEAADEVMGKNGEKFKEKVHKIAKGE